MIETKRRGRPSGVKMPPLLRIALNYYVESQKGSSKRDRREIVAPKLGMSQRHLQRIINGEKNFLSKKAKGKIRDLLGFTSEEI